MNYLYPSTKNTYTILFILLFSCCSSESCKGELAKATVSSSSSRNKVWVTFFNNDTNQTFQIQDVVEGSSKSTPPLPVGKYNVQAMGYFDTGTRQLSVSADIKTCVDYSVFVDSFSSSSFRITITGKPR